MTTEALVETFHRETDELLTALEQGLLELETTSDAADAIDRLFRAAHTLKGNAGMVGFSEFVRLTHALENVLDRLRAHTLSVSEVVIEASFDAVDALRTSAQMLLDGAPTIVTPEYERALRALAELCEGEPVEAPSLEARLVDAELYFRPEFFANGEDITTFLEELALLGDVIAAETLFDRVPPLDLLAPEACHVGLRARLRTTSGTMGVVGMAVLSVDEENLSVREVPEERKVDAAPANKQDARDPAEPAASVQRSPAHAAHTVAEHIRVDAEKLDGLMDLVGELVVAISQLTTTRSQLVVERLETLGRDLQTRVMSLRMLPVQDAFERFRRPMRDLAKELGKQIEFTTEGGDTQLDKKVIDALLDPLKHMLRNCVSHGLEEPAERERAGKPASGRVHVS
ncbi:MAG TPA: Hpt domain-containing protein, partial [Polyangiaceae bacterium]|nr:Hpt domain-containing protein [Polyangiaceae bacterium]